MTLFLSDKGRRSERARVGFVRSNFGPLLGLESCMPLPEKRAILDFLSRLKRTYPW